MANNKVQLSDGTVLIDLTGDTVTPDDLIEGIIAHQSDGTQITGAVFRNPKIPYIYDLNNGYVDNGTWKPENPTRTYADEYVVTGGHRYLLSLGGTVGSRFRAMFTTTEVSTATTNIVGTMIINVNNPAAYRSVNYSPPSDGYIVVAKDNIGHSGLESYLIDLTQMIGE